jgi:hypothetical protein
MDMMINDLLEYSRICSQEREFKYIQSEKILQNIEAKSGQNQNQETEQHSTSQYPTKTIN